DTTSRTIHVERALSAGQIATTKTGAARVVDLSKRLAEALASWQATLEAEALLREKTPSAFVFPSRTGKPLDVKKLAREFQILLRRAGLPRFRLYDLRHTFATHLLALGAPLTYVAAQLGHAKPTTTLAYYAHWLPRGDKACIDRLTEAREGSGGDMVVTKVISARYHQNAETLENQAKKVGSPGWARTSDPLINSQVLYRLSYRGMSFRV